MTQRSEKYDAFCGDVLRMTGSEPASIEWFIEDQAFSPSYDLAPRTPPPLPSENCLSFTVFLCVAGLA